MALNNVPQAGQTLSASRSLIQTNFSVIDTAFSTDHVAYNAADQGKHAKVSFLSNGATSPILQANAVILYNATSQLATNPNQELWLFKSAGTTDPVTAIDFTSAVYNATGQTQLPSGIKLAWGKITTSTIPLQTDLNAAAKYTWTTVYQVVITPVGNTPYNNSIVLVSTSGSKFTVSSNSVPYTFTYLAIGI